MQKSFHKALLFHFIILGDRIYQPAMGYATPRFYISHSASLCGIYLVQGGINLDILWLVVGQAIILYDRVLAEIKDNLTYCGSRMGRFHLVSQNME